jgi:flagellar biosynthesis protein FlhF
MRLRTFTAHDMPAAMTMVREALGDAAIILKTSNKGKGNVTITAAVDDRDDDAPVKPSAATPSAPKAIRHNNEQSDQLRFDMQEVLRFHNVPEHFISKIMQQATDKELAAFQALKDISASRDSSFLLRRGMEKLMAGFFHYDPLDFTAPGTRLMLVGPPGIGKTLTIAKIAARLVMEDEPRALSIITTDNKRAGGFEQLQSLTNIMGVQLQAADNADELATLLKACKPRMRVLIDTAGCNPYDREEMQELKHYASLAHIEPVMVLPAGGDSLEAIDIVEAFMDMPIERLLITRTDTAKRFGGIIAAAASHKLAFCHSSSSSSIVDSLHSVDASDLAGLLLNYKQRH